MIKTTPKPIFPRLARVGDLSTSLINTHKNESENFSIELAQLIAKNKLGIPNAKIRVERVNQSGNSFREFFLDKLLLVREQTFIRQNQQKIEREFYPFLCEKNVDLHNESDKMTPTTKAETSFAFEFIKQQLATL